MICGVYPINKWGTEMITRFKMGFSSKEGFKKVWHVFCGLFQSRCLIPATSHLVFVHKIGSWFTMWNQFHSVLEQHPPARSVWMSFWGTICLTQSAQACILYLHSVVYHICPQKISNSVKARTGSHGRAGCHWCTWQQQSLSHFVVLTDVKTERICHDAQTNSQLELRYKYFKK